MAISSHQACYLAYELTRMGETAGKLLQTIVKQAEVTSGIFVGCRHRVVLREGVSTVPVCQPGGDCRMNSKFRCLLYP
jgi:hypothetical protein